MGDRGGPTKATAGGRWLPADVQTKHWQGNSAGSAPTCGFSVCACPQPVPAGCGRASGSGGGEGRSRPGGVRPSGHNQHHVTGKSCAGAMRIPQLHCMWPSVDVDAGGAGAIDGYAVRNRRLEVTHTQHATNNFDFSTPSKFVCNEFTELAIYCI